ERLRFRPWGAQGGRPGAPARLLLNAGTHTARELGKIDVLPTHAGDIVTLLTPGGGGWGDPLQRVPEAVAGDLARGLISAATASDVYGVVLRDGRVDEAATRARRAEL